MSRGDFFKRLFGNKSEPTNPPPPGPPEQPQPSAPGKPSPSESSPDQTPPASGSNDPGTWPAGKLVGESCVIREMLARTPTTVVYRAFDGAKQREVAIKVLLGRWRKEPDGQHRWVRFADDPRAMDCLKEEVKSDVDVDYPHIVRTFQLVHDASTEELPAILMEYCAGGSLADRIYGTGPLSLPEGLGAAIQVCWALQYLHDKQRMHLNLKSQNVLLVPEERGGPGRVLVSDSALGWAYGGRAFEGAEWPEDPDEADLCETVLDNRGTPTHMASELWTTWPTTSPSMDVYAFGVLLYEIFCGRLPFAGSHLRELRRAHAEAPPPDPREWNPEIPPGLKDIMQHCLAKHSSDRPATFRELTAGLSALYREATGLDYEAARPKQATPELDLELVKREAWRKATAGVGAHRNGDLQRACRLMTEGEETFRSLNDPGALQWTLNRHALVLRDCEKLDEASTLLEEQKALCEQLGDRGALSTCLCAQGLVLKDQGQLEASLRVLQENEAICRELDDQVNLSGCLFNQASVLADQERLEEAMEKLVETERISRELGEPASLQESLHYHALILKACGRLDEALQLFKQQEAICRELEDAEALSACLADQESILRDLGR